MKIQSSFSTIVVCLLMLFSIASCKKKVAYDPANYDNLAYVKEVVPPREKVYKFRAEVGDEVWDTKGSATVYGDTLVISASIGGQTIKISLSKYTERKVFLIEHAQDSASLTADGKTTYDYASIVGSEGKVTVTNLDQKFNQITGVFNFTLFNDAGDSIVIRNGSFTINYSPNAVLWTERIRGNNGIVSPIVSDSIWAVAKDSKIEVHAQGLVSSDIRKVQLVFPNNIEDATFLLNSPNDVTKGRVFAYYVSDGETIPAIAGTITLNSNASNVVRGKFDNLRFTSKSGKTFSLSNGTFSSEY